MNIGNIEVSGQLLPIAAGGLFALLLGIILLMKFRFWQNSETLISENENQQNFANRNKYPQLNVFGLSGTFFNVGLLFAVTISILAFNWTQYEIVDNQPMEMIDIDPDLLVIPPQIFKKPPPPPPPPPPQKLDIIDDEEIEESIEFQSADIEEDTEVFAPESPKKVAKPIVKPPRPPEPKVDDGPLIFAETMPSFPGCDASLDKIARKKCADKEMLEFIYGNIKYPAIARENGIEGMVVIRFIIEKNGEISNAQIVREIGGGCGEEAKRVVNKMPKWNPGRQNGRPVRVLFNLPVKYSLQ